MREVFFCTPSLETLDRGLDAAIPTQTSGGIYDALVDDEVVDGMLKVDDNWDLEGAFSIEEVANGAVKHCLQQLQKWCRAKKRRAPGNVSELLKLPTAPVEESLTNATEVLQGIAASTGLNVSDA